ncbi:MAG: glycogen/starch/alpha-glucan phosphorylase [Planctomycetia bacterium]|nr:glycogen/starch/alpha-glucan phosphorylase [Planctomycetia bacterium]
MPRRPSKPRTIRRQAQTRHDSTRTALTVPALKRAILDNLFFIQGKFPAVATRNDYYMAVACTVRDRLLDRWINTARSYYQERSRTVCYLSAEFLLGPQLGNNLINLGIYPQVRQAVEELDLNLDELLDHEPEPGLGNGGLGRLAACFLDSLATRQIPCIGYGIRYEFGIFEQEIVDGWQVERADKWLRLGNPWEIARPEIRLDVKYGGRTEHRRDGDGRLRVYWLPERIVKGTPYDMPVLGYRVNTANLLRLWKAEACECFDLSAFNVGDYYRAVDEKVVSENVTKVLYPNDSFLTGKELRLRQQYFFVSCALQDMIRLFRQRDLKLDCFHEKFAVQLNDTHAAIAVAELMRLLVDEHELDWDAAWGVTTRTFAYTNHTLLPEALEKWPLALFQKLLPRHLEIIFEINRRFLDPVRVRFAGDDDRVARLSLIDEGGERYVRMAHLACVGSHAVNGVSALHTDLLKRHVLRDFHELAPEKFSNKTNGVTPRRFLLLANPRLAALLDDRIGNGWVSQLEELRRLESQVGDPGLRRAWRKVKQANKRDLARYVRQRLGIAVDPQSLFDVHVKRFHEYKRQHLNLLHAITLYNRLRSGGREGFVPRTVFFGGKAAPGYALAKQIIKLIHAVADVVNRDEESGGLLKVVFLPNFNVAGAQRIYPAADLSQQISTAGMEASGTGNMKFALNGALTIGTLDGANIEIRQEVGEENFFRFGLSADEVRGVKARGHCPRQHYESDPELRAAIDLIREGYFSRGDREVFRPLVESLLDHDPYLVLADYRSYVRAQDEAGRAFQDADRWTRMSILNVARMGKFSSDRAVEEYCRDIWHTEPAPVEM